MRNPNCKVALAGWYDTQGCGKCNDYCRWVGFSGSGGNPKKKTQTKNGRSYWSCHIGKKSLTPKGKFGKTFK